VSKTALESLESIRTENFTQEIELEENSLDLLEAGLEQHNKNSENDLEGLIFEERSNNGTYLGVRDSKPVIGTNRGFLEHDIAGENLFLFMIFHELGHHRYTEFCQHEGDVPYMGGLLDDGDILEEFSNDLIDTSLNELLAELNAYEISSETGLEDPNVLNRNPFYQYNSGQFYREMLAAEEERVFASKAKEAKEGIKNNSWNSSEELKEDLDILRSQEHYSEILRNKNLNKPVFRRFDVFSGDLENFSYWIDLYRNLELVDMEEEVDESRFLSEYLKQNPVNDGSVEEVVDPVHARIRQSLEEEEVSASTIHDAVKEIDVYEDVVDVSREKALAEIDNLVDDFYREDSIDKNNFVDVILDRSNYRSETNYHHGVGCLTGEILHEKGVSSDDVLDNQEFYRDLLEDLISFTFGYGLETDYGIRSGDPESYRSRVESKIDRKL